MATERRAEIDIGLTKNGARGALILSTDKSMRGGVRSHVFVVWFEDGCMTFILCGDFAKTVEQSVYTQKATQKAIDQQHAKAFAPERVAGLLQEVLEYYIGKPGVVDMRGKEADA